MHLTLCAFMHTNALMLDPIIEFENACTSAGVDPVAVLARAGMHRSNWGRWKSGESSPTVRNFMACRDALVDMVGASVMAGIVSAGSISGAENPDQNVTRTNEPGSLVAGVVA